MKVLDQSSAENLNEQVPLEPDSTRRTRTVDGRILAVHGAQYLVEVEGDLHRCYLSGKLKYAREGSSAATRTDWSGRRDERETRGRWSRNREQAPPTSPVAVGDYVVARIDGHGSGHVMERLPRSSWLGRVRPTKGPQVIAANVEVALVVMSVSEPEPDLYLLDQFLVQSAAGGLRPWVIFNKADLLPNQPSESPPGDATSYLCERCPEARIYQQIGYPVYCLSAESGAGLKKLDRDLHGQTAVFVGPSGVGKSSLLNHLIPQAEARIGEISEWSGRGQHTTTHVAMYPLPGGGYLVDAPGIRRLALWQVAPGDLASYFPEFIEPSTRCEFSGCAHLEETECGVKSAVEAGAIDWRRYRHYQAMRASA